jgi:hypothetical protein
MQILVVGKGDEFDEPLSVFGEVNEIDLSIPSPDAGEFAASDDELAEGREILCKAAQACGGVENFRQVENIISEADVNLDTPQGAMALGLKSIQVMPDKSVQTIKMPMGEQVVVFDGTNGWVSVGGQTQVMPVSQVEDEKKGIARNSVWLFSNCDREDLIQAASKGLESFKGQEAYRLDIKAENGAQFTLYIAPDSFLPIGMRYMGETMMGPGEVVQSFDLYKEFGGVKLPTKTVMDQPGGMTIETMLTEVQVNGQFDASLFEKPEGI